MSNSFLQAVIDYDIAVIGYDIDDYKISTKSVRECGLNKK